MAGLLYRSDMDDVRARLTAWWHGADLGRPMLLIGVPSDAVRESVPPALPQPEGWVTHYSTKSFEYRVNLAQRAFLNYECLAEAVPTVSPDLAPNCLALYLGCRGVEMPGTVWCEPFLREPAAPGFRFDPSNFYWQFSDRLGREQARLGRGKWMLQFPDLIEGLDTLAAMRGTEELLFDLVERPEWVQACLRQITDRYFDYYDRFYDLMRDEVGGSVFWAWAPGRMAKFQCDFSAMIGPEMFGTFMVPVLAEMTARVSYSMYHWDGPGAIPHHDHLLSLPKLNMLQWTPGSGTEPCEHPRWWPLYHKTVDAGKKIFIGVGSRAGLDALRREFGPKLKHFLIGCWFPQTKAEALRLIAELER